MSGRGWLQLNIPILLLLVAFLVGGCAPPIKTTVGDVAKDPSLFRNKDVELKGNVVRNTVQGEMYATWYLTLVSDGDEVVCHEEGWNTGVMRQGWNLAERAREDGEEIVVTGTVRVRHREMARGERLDLRSIAYGGQLIQTDYGDFPPLAWAGRYPHPLFLWPRPWRYHHYGPFFPYGWHSPFYDPYYWYWY